MAKEALETKKLRTEVWKNGLYIIAVLVAALWTYVTFGSLKKVYLAEAEVTQIEANNVALEFKITANEITIDKKGRIGVEVAVSITNKGIYRIDVDLNDPETFTVAQIQDAVYQNTDGVWSVSSLPVSKVYTTKPYSRLTQQVIRNVTSTSVPPSVTVDVKYFLYVDEPGLYYASFISVIPEDVLEIMTKQEIGDQDEAVTHESAWLVQSYFELKRKEL